MIIKAKRSWKDDIDQKDHARLTRRDFLRRGMFTGAATVMIPHTLSALIARNAFGSQASCPAQTRTAGGLAQVFREGGPTVGAMFLNETQVGFLSGAQGANIANRYGIVAADIVQVGRNWYVAKSSPFAIALMTPPAGFSQTHWNSILMNTSLGGHYGAFSADDGAGTNTGLLGSSANFKSSLLGKDLRFNNSAALAPWSKGNAATNVPGGTTGITSAGVAKNFGIVPAGKITSQVMTNTAQAADSLSQIFMSLFGAAGRTGSRPAVSKAVCGFYGDSAMADPTFASTLFDPTKISALTNTVTVASLTAEEQALLAAYYQSAVGSIGGVFIEQNGCDYHGTSVQNTIAPSDFEAGRMFAMFLAACAAAGTKGAIISLHNGQAIASGTQAVTVNNQDMNGPVAQGDAGGSYNAGFILCYDPSSPPTLKTTGVFNTNSGNVSPAPAVVSNNEAVAGLYLTAFAHLGLDYNAAATAMQGVGLASSVSSIILI